MSQTYAAVKWNANKRGYDLVIASGVLSYLAIFFVVGKQIAPPGQSAGDEVLLIRAFGTCAILMLHIVLLIGPLARLDRRIAPLLYNRRHLGVATFMVAAAHGVLATGYYHGFGRMNPLVSLFSSNLNYASWRGFPFETLGAAALAILFVMAISSHDFWQKVLGPSVWKGLHMAIYPAYALVVLHVALGALQSERSIAYPLLLWGGAGAVAGLHLYVGWREWRRDAAPPPHAAMDPVATMDPAVDDRDAAWIDVGLVDDIPDLRAKVVATPGGERVAIFRQGLTVSAVTNVCAHQRGPLGEGKIVDGCITCPWHGWEYRPADGRSPPPFEERIATYRLRIVARRIYLHPEPLPPGTYVEPARYEEESHAVVG